MQDGSHRWPLRVPTGGETDRGRKIPDKEEIHVTVPRRAGVGAALGKRSPRGPGEEVDGRVNPREGDVLPGHLPQGHYHWAIRGRSGWTGLRFEDVRDTGQEPVTLTVGEGGRTLRFPE